MGEGQPTGAAAGASSYSARSGGIFGILSEMQAEFSRDLGADQKAELEALISFQKLRAAKLGEISAGQEARKQKEEVLADTMSKEAQAKEDLESTKSALAADQAFLLELEKTCKENVDSYAERSKMRSEELVALGEAIKILTQDEARDLFGKSFSLLQLHAKSSAEGQVVGLAAGGTVADAARNKAIDKAMKNILRVARKHHNWVLASLAVRVRLDAFTKVKEVMDKMLAELRSQQKAEAEKKDFCNQEIDQLEDSLQDAGHQHEDLQAKKLGLENSVATLKVDIENLQSEVAGLQVALKQAGEERKKANLLFQQSISDQRATINVLEKAKARLEQFYSPKKAALAQVASGHRQPGRPVAPPPPKPQAYEKSGGAGGVLQLIEMIIGDATREEVVLLKQEQKAQEGYAALARDTTAAIQADSSSIVEKTKLMEEASGAKSETEAALLANEEEAAKLDSTLKGMHLDCDWVLKYYDIRQEARGEEIDAIEQAKAILSGADFGKAASA